MACKCVETVNEKLVSRNTRLSQAMMFGPADHEGLMLETEQIESGRGKPKAVSMFLTYCPFCGVKYQSSHPMEDDGNWPDGKLSPATPDPEQVRGK